MAKRKRAIPQYGTVTLNGIDYYRTRVQNADGKLVALYARTPEELYDKDICLNLQWQLGVLVEEEMSGSVKM